LSSNEPVQVTVVIAARDEAANIEACIASVRWAREVIVIENDSSDDTVQRAVRAGATVVSHPFVTIGGQRNVAIERAGSEWILVLDADERATPALADEIRELIGRSPAREAYRVPRHNFFLGREIRHGGWGSDRPVRLFRSGLRYNSSRVHEHVETHCETGELEECLEHTPYVSLDNYFIKFERYSRWWADDRFERGRRVSAMSFVVRPPARFASMYLLRGGWLDGAAGALLSCLAAASVMAKYARLWEKSHKKNGIDE